ncbi:class I SAM-dependent methyltransferase [Pseudoclavibacter sp. VKM Ac-2867]|uniref:class I SAM-dependent methyltransferase n=1 Tax=Pseudoclavibacter sp. VKM Ac-2867 TaxID=2783829 RepID=UPI00188AE5F7|nr:class I SAM-dependent methyltransferase [Pseudoclavibacter sp. VKM Ac-2867]MBF4457902.1 class I SAM-dependent methyltransferase [Pseudoclavibacter sp. VKM Ac-2867]
MSNTTDAYSLRADEYSSLLGSMESVHDSDRQLIDSWAAAVEGRVLDAGCGPGHWTNYLASRGLEVRGIDLVPDFIERARSSYPGVRFDVGSIYEIDEPDDSLGGVLSWYSTIHHDPSRISEPLTEFARVLRAGGLLVVGYFEGPACEAFDHAITTAYRWPASELERALEACGFEVLESHRRTSRTHRPHGAVVCRLA